MPGLDQPLDERDALAVGCILLLANLEKESSLLYYGLYDHCVIGYAIRPNLFTLAKMNVDLSIAQGPTYGACYGYIKGPYISGVEDHFPLDDGSNVMKVAWTRILFREGVPIQGQSCRWSMGESGESYFFFGDSNGYPPGNYEARLFIGAEAVSRLSFTVGGL